MVAQAHTGHRMAAETGAGVGAGRWRAMACVWAFEPEPAKTLHMGPLQLRKPDHTHGTPGKVLDPSAHNYPQTGARDVAVCRAPFHSAVTGGRR